MNPNNPGEAWREIDRQVRRAIAAVLAGAVLISLLVVAAHRGIAWTDDIENQYHRRAAALADRLHLTLRAVQLPIGFEGDPADAQLRQPEDFAAEAQRAYRDALSVAQELTALHARHAELGGFERAMQRLARAVQALEALHRAREGDRLGFALALATADTYLEIVSLQLRSQHEAALASLIESRRKLLVALEVAGAAVLVVIVLVTRRFVQRSFVAVHTVLLNDARRSLQLSDSLDAFAEAMRRKDARIEESAERVLSMALVHDRLYARGEGRIAARELLDQLATRLSQVHAAAESRVVAHADDLEIALEWAVPCALILNELAANALRHAYEPGIGGTVRLSMERLPDGRACIAVADDGKGLPAGFSPRDATSLGMRIVVSLARQMGGELACRGDRGTRCEVVFDPGPRTQGQRA